MDETHKRLLDWTYQQAPSERLAAQILDDEGYKDIDPSHPLGGPDGGRDGHCTRDGEQGVWAVYFPRGQQSPKDVSDKLKADIDAAQKHNPEFLVFVTNQEIKHSERNALRSLGGDIRIELLHLERIATNLDRPRMAAVREHFLRIPATPVSQEPSLDIEVSVVGTAHMFTNDADVLDIFVDIHENSIRKESDKEHARLRAEQDKKALAEAEKRAREVREATEKARKARRDALMPQRPWAADIEMPAMTDWVRDSKIMDAFLGQPRVPDLLSRMPGVGGPSPKPREALSDEQIDAQVSAYRTGLESRWPACRDYLAGVGWGGVHFRIKNRTKAFLTDVEVVITFQGARGVDHIDLGDFQIMKVQDPDWEPPLTSPYGIPVMPVMPLYRAKDFPIRWRQNTDGDLQVSITLPSLRPMATWQSDGYGDEIVLVVDPGLEVDQIAVTSTATARDHNDVFEAAPMSVPLERVPMLAKLQEVRQAAKDTATD